LVQVSDIRVTDLDSLLRIWISQMLENSLERWAKYIEIHLFEKGILGFDVVDDGDGIPEKEFEDKNYARSMENRQRNEIYKTRSIGYKGEALDSLARATELTIITK
jgi:DNA mismatch repair ATPase MutL